MIMCFRLIPTQSLFLATILALPTAGTAVAGEDKIDVRTSASLGADRPTGGAVFAVRTSLPGLDYRNICGEQQQLPILEQNGQGVALIDYDDDGLIDIFFRNGSTLARLKTGRNPGSRLYRNLGGWRFEDVTRKAGIHCKAFGNGAAVADYDADGDFDIYLTNWGENALLRNNGDGTFTDVTAPAGVGGTHHWSSSAAFADFNGDGRLDLYVSNYVDFDPNNVPQAEADGRPCMYRGIVTGCGPWRYQGQHDTLYIQQPDGRFRDASAEWGLEVTNGFRGFTAVAADFDNDGDVDVFVGCDVMPNLRLENVDNKRFRTVGYVGGGAVNAVGMHESGMGVAAVDWVGAGWIDLFVTNFAGEKNTHYANSAGFFEDKSIRTGFDKHRPEMGWAMLAADFDQDGYNDLLVCNGHIYPQVGKLGDPFDTYAQSPRLYLGTSGGTVSELSPEKAFQPPGKWSLRGAVAGDLDNDGDLDVIAVQHNGPPVVFENLSRRRSLIVELHSKTGGRSPHGARVGVAGKWHVHLPNQGYQSSQDHRLFISLPTQKQPDSVTVVWPKGGTETFLVPSSKSSTGRLARVLCVQGAGTPSKAAIPFRLASRGTSS